jgi:type I restriction enzyme S subunit
MAQAIFKSWFVDFEPFGGEIPGDWGEDSIYQLMDVIYGAPFKSALFNSGKVGYPLIRIRDLKTFAPQFFTPETLPKMEIVQEGDVLVGMDAEFRPCIWKGETGVLNQRVCKIVPKSGICRFFVYAALKPHLEFIEFHKTGTTVSHIGKADFDRIQITIPPEKVLNGFSELVEPLYLQVLNSSHESLRLAALRDTLLPRLMSGELSVADLSGLK